MGSHGSKAVAIALKFGAHVTLVDIGEGEIDTGLAATS